MRSHTNNRLEYVLVLKALGPLGGDLHLLHRACKGIGTHEDLLNELLLGRTNEEIFHLKEGYKRVYGKDLVKVVQGELSMKTERLFNMAMSGTRDESPMVNHQLVQQDVEALYRAGAGKIGTVSGERSVALIVRMRLRFAESSYRAQMPTCRRSPSNSPRGIGQPCQRCKREERRC